MKNLLKIPLTKSWFSRKNNIWCYCCMTWGMGDGPWSQMVRAPYGMKVVCLCFKNMLKLGCKKKQTSAQLVPRFVNMVYSWYMVDIYICCIYIYIYGIYIYGVYIYMVYIWYMVYIYILRMIPRMAHWIHWIHWSLPHCIPVCLGTKQATSSHCIFPYDCWLSPCCPCHFHWDM